jgi:hypothetical protein
MRQTNRPWLQGWLQGLGLEFWLPLPLLSIIFWLSCNLISAHVLNRSYGAKDKLKTDTQPDMQVPLNISTIKALINPAQGVTRIEIHTTEPDLNKLEFALPLPDARLIETVQIEALIAQELGISRQESRKLMHYEVID